MYDNISRSDYMSNVVECIERHSNPKGPTMVVGDFNCPDIVWGGSSVPCNRTSLQLYDCAISNGFVQVVSEPTRGNNLVDLVLTNQPFRVLIANVEHSFGSSDHNSVSFSVAFERIKSRTVEGVQRRYLWKKGNYEDMSHYLNEYDWAYMLSVNFKPDDLWGAFCKVLNDAIDLYVPSVIIRNNYTSSVLRKYPRRIQTLFTRKRCVWRQMRSNPNDTVLRSNYKRLVYECREATKDYERSQEASILESQNISAFYRFIDRRLHNSRPAPVLLKDDGLPVHTDLDKAELFNSYFNSVNVNDNGILPDFPTRVNSDTKLDDIQFSEEKLHRVTKRMKGKMTCDPDGYSPYLIKQIIPALAGPLSLLFNSFFSTKDIPSSWKKAIITPIYKKGPSSDPANYRPVSLTSVFGKLMERVVASEMLHYLLENRLLSADQHGSLSKRSTLTNLLESVSDWSISIENKFQNQVAYIDFSRAFYSVSHQKLLHKLKSYGFDGLLLQWIGSFLSNRIHCTQVGNAHSSFKHIRSGVVQGSCLGPLLFLIFINDIADNFNLPFKCKMYADDVKLYTEMKSVSDVLCFQSILNSVYSWSVNWQRSISSKKCNIVSIGKPTICSPKYQYYLGHEHITMSVSMSDLGVLIDSSLCFSDHITNITGKAHQRACLIHRCFTSKDRSMLVKAFITYVRPLLEYNSPIWSPASIKDIHHIEGVQRKFTKRIPGMSELTYYSRLKALCLESLELRRLRADLILVYKIVFGLLCVSSDAFFSPRAQSQLRGHSYTLSKQRCSSSVMRSFFSSRVINMWNNLPASSTQFSSLSSFCKTVPNTYLINFCRVNFT